MSFGSTPLGLLPLGGIAVEGQERITIEEALLAQVQSLTGLDAVFYGRNPRGPQELPCVVIEKVSEEREETFSGRGANCTYVFLVKVWTFSPSLSVDLSRTLRDGLDGFSGVLISRDVGLVWNDGDTDEIRSPGDGSEDWIYGRHLTFGIIALDD